MGNNQVAEVSPTGLSVVTRQDVDALRAQRELLKEFVSGQLKEANFKDDRAADYGEGDFGIIPGTKKKVLLKPGAEKLLQLFNLGARFKLVQKEVDRHANFALYEYECEIYNRKTQAVIANCIGTANSQEVKYRERTTWKTKTVNGKSIRESVKEETPIFDVLNTLSKMAQKRALIGAAILATAASDFFTQDMEPDESAQVRDEPKDVTPKAASADEGPAKDPNEPPICCGRPMMVSKYPNRETGDIDWYCLSCKIPRPRGAA